VKTRHSLLALFALTALLSEVQALTPPSSSDGPIRVMGCTVNPQGILEASVDNQSEEAMSCVIRCHYELGEKMFTQIFNVTIPARFNGSVGRFDTSNGKTGNYTGDLVGECKNGAR